MGNKKKSPWIDILGLKAYQADDFAINKKQIKATTDEIENLSDLAQKVQLFKSKVKGHINQAIEHLNSGEKAKKNLDSCHLKAWACVRYALQDLETLTATYEKKLTLLSFEYQEDIRVILQSYKKDKNPLPPLPNNIGNNSNDQAT